MNEPTLTRDAERPTAKSLFRATVGAVLIAALLLVLVVLPAEYGIDPTGVGAGLGLAAMKQSPQASGQDVESMSADEIAAEVLGERPDETLLEPTTSSALAAVDTVWKSRTPYRNDAMSLTLDADEGAEIKARMRAGERFVFSWVADGPVNFDMHGEVVNAKQDEFTSYWKDRGQTSGHGAFIAPFDGIHGWYWRNRGDKAVTVRVQTSGFYAELFRP
jgi:hypothetical protein